MLAEWWSRPLRSLRDQNEHTTSTSGESAVPKTDGFETIILTFAWLQERRSGVVESLLLLAWCTYVTTRRLLHHHPENPSLRPGSLGTSFLRAALLGPD